MHVKRLKMYDNNRFFKNGIHKYVVFSVDFESRIVKCYRYSKWLKFKSFLKLEDRVRYFAIGSNFDHNNKF